MKTKTKKLALMTMVLTTVLTAIVASCGQSKHKAHKPSQEPIASNVIVNHNNETPIPSSGALAEADAVNVRGGASRASDNISAEITLKKAQILDRTFLYGFDMQYSSGVNPEYELIDQSTAMGHVPVTFQIFGDKLRVFTDSSRLFESMVNHPETLVSEYRILSQNVDTVTVTIDRPGLLLHKAVNGKDAPAPNISWVRSLKFVEEGNYLLQESAFLLADGRVQTYMESLFPRESLVPADYHGIENNADKNPQASRFMLLDNEKVFVERKITNGVPVREETSFANRYLLADANSTIDWYVTPNMPDDFMKEMKSGVEGWNRYFHDQLGRDVVQFKGRLPEGINIGDPRYNVINFDTVGEAGAAYESQASDPMTGIQSHSLIYMPYAWYNIAAKLSDARELPLGEDFKRGPKSPEILFGAARDVIRCVRDARDVSTSPIQATLASASEEGAAKVVDEFGRRIFISTLFHEMGHSFGLNHNFKGSLSFDGTKPVDFATNPTTDSVMDYNYYQHEVDLMDEIGMSNGPRLEYDRQIISYLYNEGRDIKDTDRVLPSCADDEADDINGGVDPDCIRYDAELSPMIGLEHSYSRLADASGARGIETLTLSQAITAHKDEVVARLADAVKTPDAAAAKKLITNRAAALGKLVGYYVSAGAQSLRVNLRLNEGSLRAWRSVDTAVDTAVDAAASPAVVTAAMSESQRRNQYFDVLNKSITMTALPAAPASAMEGMTAMIASTIIQNERFGTAEERTALAAAVTKEISDSVATATSDAFAKLRGTVAGTLTTGKEKASFASFQRGGETAEQLAVAMLGKITLLGLSATDIGTEPSQAARIAGVKALAAFSLLGDDYKDEITAVKSALIVFRNAARQGGKQDVVDHVRALINELPHTSPAI
jgi:Met-zincin